MPSAHLMPQKISLLDNILQPTDYAKKFDLNLNQFLFLLHQKLPKQQQYFHEMQSKQFPYSILLFLRGHINHQYYQSLRLPNPVSGVYGLPWHSPLRLH